MLSLIELLQRRAGDDPEQDVYTFITGREAEPDSLTCQELDRQARAIGALVQASGGQGERALLLYPPGLDFVSAFFGALYGGAVAVPSYPPRVGREQPRLRAIARDAAPRVVLTTAALAARADTLISEIPELAGAVWLATDALPSGLEGEWQDPGTGPGTLAFLQYTSGSTADPKGVMVTHGNLLHNQEMIRRAFGQSRDSVIAGWLPLYHDMGLIGNVMQPLYVGGRCILMSPLTFLQRPLRWLEAVSRYRATTSGGPNFAYELCVRKIAGREHEHADLDLSSWTLAFNGAEPVWAETLERFAAAFAPFGFDRRALYPCYGLAEATLFVCGGKPGRSPVVIPVEAPALEKGLAVRSVGGRDLVGCGNAWMGQEVRIVDPETGEGREDGQVGEVWVAGPSVAAGYWGRPDETASTFVRQGTERFLRTGDLGFLLGGELFITGRLKDLIILRGRNLYPQDVELSAERSHPALRAGCTAAFSTDLGGEERLVVVAEAERGREGELAEIAGAMRRAVAEEHDAQIHEVVLLPPGRLLKTSSGKIQRRACRSQYLSGELPAVGRSALRAAEAPAAGLPEEGAEGAGAGEGIESWLCERVARVFGLPPGSVGRDQPLTSLGIDSLSAVELQHAVEEDLGIQLAVTDLLAGPTVGELAERLASQTGRERDADEPTAATAAPMAVAREEIPLSYGQRALWFLHGLRQESSAYNIAAAVRVRSALDLDALRQAWEILSQRHDALRASFSETAEGPVQRIRPGGGVRFFVEVLEEPGEEGLQRRMSEEAERPFDLERDLLLRLGVFPLAGGEHAILLVIHHIIADLWSLAVLVRELGAVYSALCEGHEPRLAPLPLSYSAAVEGQLRQVEGEAGERLWAYWSERLGGGLPVLDLPTDRPRPLVQSFRGGTRSLTLSPFQHEGLLALGRDRRATLFTVLLATFQTLLHRYSGQTDLIVGSPSAGREAPGLASVVGYFVNPLPLGTDLSGEPSFVELVDRVRESVLGAFRHQGLPFPLMVERLQPERDPGRSPIFQSMLVLQKAHLPELRDIAAFALGHEGARFVGLGGLELESMALERRVSQFDLELMAAETRHGLVLTLIYDSDLFDAATAERALRHFEVLAGGVADQPRRPISDLPLLTGDERQQLLSWNDSVVELPSGGTLCFPELFEEQVARTPDAIAAEEGEQALTYAELNAGANRLARFLLRTGAGPEDRIAVWADRGIDFLRAFLSILKAGCAYLPLDPRQPAPRLLQMLERGGCRMVLASEARFGECSAALARREEPRPAVVPLWSPRLEDFSGEDFRADFRAELTPARLAYVLFTSGSTGLPKGAMIEHGGMLNHMLAKIRDLGMGPSDVLAQTAAPTFDISVWQFLSALLAGGRVRILSDDVVADPALLLSAAEERQVTVLEVVPSMMRALLDEVARASPESRPRLAALRWLIPTGEALSPELCRAWFTSYPDIPLVNAYGPTECSDDVTHHVLTGPLPDDAPRTPVGRPVMNMRLYVVDRGLSPLPVSVHGELCVAGIGVGRGYLDDPARTAVTFVPDPFSSVPGGRLYRTGDLGLRRPDGLLEVLGRSDDQVKIRGFRIELGEVEAALAVHPGVREAVVLASRDRRGEALLAAYWTAQAEASASAADLREHLRQRLPEAMVPAGFVLLEALPLTPNGKIDRRALSRIEPEPDSAPGEGEGPRTPTEEILGRIWEQVLGIERPGRHSSFFELGGHSLLATRVISRVREVFRIDLPLRAAFEEPTLAGLAQRIESHRLEEGVELPPLLCAPRDQPLPLSFAQERLWFLDQMEPDDPWYNMPIAIRLEGHLDALALQRALSEVARRHETLRTAFLILESGPVQAVLPPEPLEVARLDLTGLPERERRQAALRVAAEEARRPFSLAAGRLLRSSLLRLGEREHVLLLTLHHIVADGWSLGVFVQELSALYRTLAQGAQESAAGLPELPVQYADFAVWQREWLTGAVLEDQLSWWRQHLTNAPAVLELPADRSRPAVRSTRGGRAPLTLPPQLVRELERLSLRESATLFMTLFTAFQILLGRLAGREDLVVGTPIAGRARPELEELIGLFLNTLALRGDLSGDPAFGEHLARVREASLGAYAHQELPFERLVEELAPERNLTHAPVFQVLFVFQNAPPAALELPGLTWNLLDSDSGTAKFDLTLTLQEEGEGLAGQLGFNRDLFDEATVRRWAGHLGVLLEGIVREPEKRLSERELMSAAERHQVLRAWNDTARGVVEETLHGLFVAQARRTPEAAALRYEGEEMSFGELDRRSNQLARFLRNHGVAPDVLVGLCMERSLELVVGVLGILKAGGGYVPLDPGYPVERLAYMLEDSGAPVLLGQERLQDRMPESGAMRVLVDADWERIKAYGAEPLPELADPDHLACVLYTSGSTGRPKGVMDSHRCVINQLRWLQSTYCLDGTDRVLQKTPISWDVSLWELFWPLSSGACMVLAQPGGHQDPRYLATTIAGERITTVHFVPSMLRIFLESESGESCSSLRRVVSSGEALGLDLEERFFASFSVDLNNMYGPGESARTTLWRCERGNTRAVAPIGRPTHDTQVYVLDGRMEPVPIGVTGELWVASQSMARGYHLRPGLTAEKFLPNPFGTPGTRLYRTGDLGRTLSDGTLEFLGRIDHQVKIRGVRIELGEIESTLGQHPGIGKCVVAAQPIPGSRNGTHQGGGLRLVAYVVPVDPGRVSDRSLPRELRDFLGERLPEYAVPSSCIVLDALPLAPNGKLDRSSLPEPAMEWGADRPAHAAPRTTAEEILAGIWADVLETGEEVGIHESFFELGGHSLLAMRMVSRVRTAFQTELPVRAVFEEPTVAGLAARIEALRRSDGAPAALPLRRLERAGAVPLSFAQERLWFLDQLLDQLGSRTGVYNISSAVPLHEQLNHGALNRSLDEIVRRHEVLRTTFTTLQGRPVQIIHPFLKAGLQVLDRSGLTADQRQAEIEALSREEARRPFDLSRGPLLRTVLVQLSPEENVLLLTFHHIVSDGWSVGVFLRELSQLYAAFCADLPSPLLPLEVQYADFAQWQRQWLQGEALESLLSYWRNQLAGAPPVLRLPTDHPRPQIPTHTGAMLAFTLPRPLADQILRLSQRQGATLFMTLLAAYLVLLYRYTGKEDLIVGSPMAGRNHAELEGLIGFFINTLVLRVPVSGNQSFRNLVARVREVTLGAYDHQDVPFEKLVEELAPGRDLSHMPLCQVVFNLQITPPWARTEEAVQTIPHSGTAKFDLNLTMAETGQGLQGAFEYNTDLFTESTILRMRDHLLAILEAVSANPEMHLLDVPLQRDPQGANGDGSPGRPVCDPGAPRLDETESFAF